MPNAMDIGFSFPTHINILAGAARQMKRRNRDEYSEYSDRKRVEAITISRQTRSKMPPTGLGAQCGASHNKTAPQSPADDAPPVHFMRRFSMRLPPTVRARHPARAHSSSNRR
jgi:hypothetical protein